MDKKINMKASPSIVCLGGGIGSVQLVRGLRDYSDKLTVVVSMADDGGSGGRLRRLFSIPPPGDLINCLAALSDAEPVLKQLLTYRFEGNRWGRDDSLKGQKLGNLILVALTKMYGDFNQALTEAERIFACHGKILPASIDNVSIWAKTVDGMRIVGEETIDRGKYNGRRQLSEIHLQPEDARASKEVLSAIKQADMIIAGPGDLYTTVLPVLAVKEIARAIRQSKVTKVFVVNIANKPFETPNYSVYDYIEAVTRHVGSFPFTSVVVNTNVKPRMPRGFRYHYVQSDIIDAAKKIKLLKADLVNAEFPLYHDSAKLAAALMKLL